MSKILIIDDSSLSRRMLRKILEEAAHEVVEAKEGFAALEIFSLENPDLVMLDLNMPGINGLEVLKKLKDIKPETKVIVASADIQTMTKDIVFEEGADGFVNKPFVFEEVIKMIQKII